MDEPLTSPVIEPLRLVRLRLGLALVATALLPFALGTLVAPVLAAADPVGQRASAGEASAALSAAISEELEGTRAGLLRLSTDPALGGALGAADADRRAGALGAIASIAGERVARALVLDTKGRPQLEIAHGRASAADGPVEAGAAITTALPGILALGPGQAVAGGPYDAASGERRILIGAPIAGAGGPPALAMVFEISLDELLAANRAAPAGDAGYAQLVELGSGRVVADSRVATDVPGGAPASARPPRPDEAVRGALARAGRAPMTISSDGWTVGSYPLSVTVPGMGDWSVLVAEPAPPLPVHLLAALGILAALLVASVVWLSRQVLRPAAELERSRHELTRLYERVRVDARTDVLTGLGNRRAWQEELERQLDTTRRHALPVALLLIDLDDFRGVNEFTGRVAADGLLRDLAELITGGIRQGDRAFRIGGDEFAVILPHADVAGALAVARRLLDAARNPRWDGRLDHPLSFSAGIAVTTQVAPESGELSAAADAALLSAKSHGRSAVEVFDPTRHRLHRPSVPEEVAEQVGQVIARRSLRAVFQPIVDLSSGRVVAYEGLVRPTPTSGFANPGILFSSAAACDRVVELDLVCFEVVAAAAAVIDIEQLVTFNLSPRTLEAADFDPARLRSILETHGFAVGRAVLELTERETLEDVERLRVSLDACRASGFRVAADDVGAGNAGLRLLSQLDFDIVKIDLSLIQRGAAHEASLEILRSLVELAGRWGAAVIAEGIETPEQLRLVRELGVSAGQGYLLGRPGTETYLHAVDLDGLEALAGPAPPRPSLGSSARGRAIPAA